MNHNFHSNNKVVELLVDKGETIIINDPSKIISFIGSPSLKKDKIVINKKSIIKKKIYKTEIHGSSRVYLSSNNIIYVLKDIPEDGIYLKNVLFYSDNVDSEIFNMSDLLTTKTYFSGYISKYKGKGIIGYCGFGNLLEVDLKEEEEIYVPVNALIGHSANFASNYKIVTYGNKLSALFMQKQFKFIGPGKVIVSYKNNSAKIENDEYSQPGIIKRSIHQIPVIGQTLQILWP